MMTIITDAIYLIFFIFLLGFLVFSGVALFHLSEYGYVGDFSRSMMVIYMAVAALIMLGTIVAMVVVR